MTSEPRTFEVAGMHCASCGLLVDDTLEDLPGVTASRTDVDRGSVTITSDVIAGPSDEAVVAAIVGLGYTAHRSTGVAPARAGSRLRRLRGR